MDFDTETSPAMELSSHSVWLQARHCRDGCSNLNNIFEKYSPSCIFGIAEDKKKKDLRNSISFF
jgi:hypothetical protein